MTYELTENRRKEFATWFLLDKMINKGKVYPLLLDGDDVHLEDLLTYMMSHEYVDIRDDKEYVATPKGREALLGFKRRYKDFLKNFDVFCAVDLEAGEFAFEEFFEYEDETLWNQFLEEERWEDLRVAVAKFKGVDPVEIVFMGLLHEGRVNDKVNNWQFDLLLGSIWDDLLEICNNALSVEDLGYVVEGEDGESDEEVSGESVLKDIINQGAKLCRQIKEEEDNDDEEDDDEPTPPGVRPIRAEVIEVEVYDHYVYDPYYLSPVWRY